MSIKCNCNIKFEKSIINILQLVFNKIKEVKYQ